MSNVKEDNIPSSFIFNTGKLGKNTKTLLNNLKLVLSPYTAKNLKATKKNSLKDFTRIGSAMGVTHFITVSRPTNLAHLRFLVSPSGPSFDFEIRQFTNMNSDNPIIEKKLFNEQPYKNPPLLVLSNFDQKVTHLQLVSSMFQNLFPSFNIEKTRLDKLKRVVFIQYDEKEEVMYFRHYYLRIQQEGLSKNVRYFVEKKLTDLQNFKDISDFISSENFEDEKSEELINFTRKMKKTGKVRSSRAVVKLESVGPSMTLKLVKIHEGMSDKKVLYHAYVIKSEEEIFELEKKHQERISLKLKRKREQEENILKKKKKKV